MSFQKIFAVESAFSEILRLKNGQKTQKTSKNRPIGRFHELFFFEKSSGLTYFWRQFIVKGHKRYHLQKTVLYPSSISKFIADFVKKRVFWHSFAFLARSYKKKSVSVVDPLKERFAGVTTSGRWAQTNHAFKSYGHFSVKKEAKFRLLSALIKTQCRRHPVTGRKVGECIWALYNACFYKKLNLRLDEPGFKKSDLWSWETNVMKGHYP